MNEPTAQPESPLFQFLFDEILNLPLPPLQIGPGHVKSVDTRSPIQSEYHKPRWRQVKTLEFNPEIFPMLEEHLKEQLRQRKCIIDGWQPEDISRWTDVVKSGIDQLVPPRGEVRNEESVKLLYGALHKKTGLLATLICFNMKKEDLQSDPRTYKSVFTLCPSAETNSKADGLVGCVSQELDDGEEKWGSLWDAMTNNPIDPDPRQDFFRTLLVVELKNPLAGNPLALAAVYTVMLLIKKRYLATFWPDNLCRGCDQYRKSHEAQALSSTAVPPGYRPVDGGTAVDALAVASEADLRDEIAHGLRLAEEYPKKCNIPDDMIKLIATGQTNQVSQENKGNGNDEGEGGSGEKRKRRVSSDEDSPRASQVAYERKLLDAFDKAQKTLKLDLKLRKWITHGAYFLIQLYAQMDIDDTTVGYFSCHNNKVVVILNRASRTLTLSNILQNDDRPLLLVTALTVFAWRDALERFALTPKEYPGRPEDPYRGQNQQQRDAEDRLAGKEPAKKQSETRPPKKPKTGKNKEPSQDVLVQSGSTPDVIGHGSNTSEDVDMENEPSRGDTPSSIDEDEGHAGSCVSQDDGRVEDSSSAGTEDEPGPDDAGTENDRGQEDTNIGAENSTGQDDVRAESEASQDDDDIDDHSTSDDAHTESDPSRDDADVQRNADDATVEQDANPDEDAAENAADVAVGDGSTRRFNPYHNPIPPIPAYDNGSIVPYHSDDDDDQTDIIHHPPHPFDANEDGRIVPYGEVSDDDGSDATLSPSESENDDDHDDDRGHGKTTRKKRKNNGGNGGSGAGGPGGGGGPRGPSGGAGGPGAGGGSNGDQGGSGGQPPAGGHGGTSKKGGAGKGKGRQSRPGGSTRAAANIDLQELHVAFNAPKRNLVSNGFEHYERIPPPNIPTTPAFRFADLSDVDEERPTTPPTKFSSISDVDGSPQLAAISPHRLDGRKASVGSVASRSDTSKGSVRSISSIPSLSGTASTTASESPPATPSATSSFPSGSKESSPLAKKRTQTAVGEGQVDPLQTILPKIQYAGVFIEEVIYEKMGRPTVWSGQLIPEDDTVESTIPIPIVVKMAVVEYQEGDESNEKGSIDLLRHEGVIYEALAKAGLGGITPRYYGAFEGDLGGAILILDDGGGTIGSFEELSKGQRQDLLTMAETMHRAGIVHNDLKPCNVVRDSSGEVKIIDFDMAVNGHRCPGKECEELIDFAKALKLDAES